MTTSRITPSKAPSSPQYQPGAGEWDVIELSPVFDLQDLVSVIKKRIFWLALFPILGVVAALIYLFFFATLYYSSTAVVFMDPKFDETIMVENVNSVASDLDSLNSLERTIGSNSMVLRVIDKLGLRNDRDFLPKSLLKKLDKGESLSDSILLKELKKSRISCALIRPTRLLEITIFDTDAERAKLIAETYVSEFESYLSEKKKIEADETVASLRQQADFAYKRALDAEKELEKFRIENPGVTVEQDHDLYPARLSKVGDDYNQVASKVLDLRSKVETLKDIDPQKNPIRVIEVGGFSGSEHISDLISARTSSKSNFVIAASQYTESHPNYKQAQKSFIELESQLTQLASELKESLIGDYLASQKNEELLLAKVIELQEGLNSQKSKASEFRAVQQKVEAEWSIHQSLRHKIIETSVSSAEPISIALEVDSPIAAHKTSKPGKPVTVLIGAFLGALVSMSFVGLALFRDKPFVNRKQIESSLNVKVLAETPRLDAPEEHRSKLLAQMSQVLLSPQHRLSKVIHVSSVEASKSGYHIASALGYASAYYGNPTLVISMIKGSEPGTLVSFNPQKANHENLFSLAIPASFLLAPENIWQMLNPHCKHFSRIILETSALDQATQVPVMISAYSDTTVLLVRNGIDNRKKIDQVLDNLRKNSRGSISVTLEG